MSIAAIITEGFAHDRVNGLLREGFAAYTGLPEPPPIGYQYETYGAGTPYSGSGFSMQQGASPADVVGNVGIGQLLTSPNAFAVTINPDGTIDVISGGNTSRQKWLFGRYILATNALDPPTFPAVTSVVWINEVAPSWNNPVILPIGGSSAIIVGQTIQPVVLQSSSYASSVSGDILVFALASGTLPPGLTLSAGQIIGTPTLAGTYLFTLSATDITGTSTTSPTCSITVANPAPITPPGATITVPSVIGMSWYDASYVLIRDRLTQNQPPLQVVSQNVAPGTVVGQSISAGTLVLPQTQVQLTVAKENLLGATFGVIPWWKFN